MAVPRRSTRADAVNLVVRGWRVRCNMARRSHHGPRTAGTALGLQKGGPVAPPITAPKNMRTSKLLPVLLTLVLISCERGGAQGPAHASPQPGWNNDVVRAEPF